MQGNLQREEIERLMRELLVDPLAETGRISGPVVHNGKHDAGSGVTVLLKPGVMDPAAMSVASAARDLGIPVDSVRTFRRYYFTHQGANAPRSPVQAALEKVLANDAIEQIVKGPITSAHLELGTPYRFQLITVPLRDLDDAALLRRSRDGQLSLSLAEMQTIQAHFRELGRDPTDVELETLAQTWSEHCSHKTLKGKIDFEGMEGGRHFDNLLKETIFAATQEIRRRLGRRTTGASASSRTTPASSASTTSITSASRWRRTTTRRPSSPTAAPTPASAASSAIRSAPAWAPSRSATPTSSASPRRTRRRSRCRPACCIRGR